MAGKKAEAQPQGDIDARILIFKAGDGGGPLVSNARQLEDDYIAYYQTQAEYGLIRPPFDFLRLEEMAQSNNTLSPCIDAMITNIDGTGWEIERADGEKMEEADDKIVEPAKQFFNECAPRMSFRTLRMQMRRQQEIIGNGYIEIIRNAAGEIVFAGPLEAKMMRIGRLTDPVPVDVTMMRGGKEVTFKQLKRERRFAQKVGENLIWFKEFGATRDLHKFQGKWFPLGSLPADLRATEVIYFQLDPDISTPYGVPRWISQTPSVLGSRKAEEHNLEYFDNGGIPPYLVIVQGGQLAEATVEAVRNALNQKGAHARVQVIEAFSTSGNLDQSSNVQVKVERFGAEKANDAMFKEYDKDCENRIRRAFRLPEILIGKTESMNFATANASYLVAEAQVFKPERDQFDEAISATILPELLDGNRDYVFRSKPISIIDAETQMKVIAAAQATGRVDPENLVTLLGETGGMEFQTVDLKDVKPAPGFGVDPVGNVIPISAGLPGGPPGPQAAKPKTATKKSEEQMATEGLTDLLGCTLAVMAAQPRFAE